MEKIFDVAIIGGSYAGMAAALQLVRARKQVLVLDKGQRRNLGVLQSHGFLGQDGEDPTEIALKAKRQLFAYDTLTWIEELVISASRKEDLNFEITLENESKYVAKRIILAVGVKDVLPDISGLQERWGKSVFACPYCHGYEMNVGSIGVIATKQFSVYQSQLLSEWGNVTIFLHDSFSLSEEQREKLLMKNITIVETAIQKIEGIADIHLIDGRIMSFNGLFISPTNSPSTSIPEQLGCELENSPFGTQIKADAQRQTSVSGVFVCGDVARTPHTVSFAVGDGVMAAMSAHRSLII